MSFNADHFYVTLPSNSSSKFFPDNTKTHFITKLSNPIQLESADDWEVGLAQIQFPKSWYNITEKNNRFAVFSTSSIDDVGKWTALEVPQGYYESIDNLVTQINDLVKDNDIHLQYELRTKKIQFSINNEKTAIRFVNGLTYNLGFHQEDVTLRHNTTHSPFQANICGTFYNIYVYSDVLQYQLVGDSFTPLLRTVTTEGKSGEMIEKSFNNVHYMPVSKSTFESIEIDLRSDTGDPIPFQDGKVVVKLHFRKRKI